MTFVLLVQIEGAAGADGRGAEQGPRTGLAIRHRLEVNRTRGTAGGPALHTAQVVASLGAAAAAHEFLPV